MFCHQVAAHLKYFITRLILHQYRVDVSGKNNFFSQGFTGKTHVNLPVEVENIEVEIIVRWQ
jgi:hypothetical protein